MSRISYVNGRYIPHPEAAIHIEDRGYQFADGVYEICGVFEGRLFDESAHIDRLERSLGELRMSMPLGRCALSVVLREVVRRNRIRDGIVYIQMTRGTAPRNHLFPPAGTSMSVVVMAWRQDMEKMEENAANGVKVKTLPDIRWGRCDIKSTSLLPNVLAKQAASDAGAYEAWLVDENGFVTEGSSSNAWIVNKQGQLITRQLNEQILPGITRGVVLELAGNYGLDVTERAFSVKEAQDAQEAFMTAATAFVTPVIQIDDKLIGNGRPGSIALDLRKAYQKAARATA
ncbi:MAG: D-amino-acid transaminase [Alphaproteobacteria bacterium]|nr:MAG: D-amino-acid transaminase [Alphaproteobacteria bacterium]